MAKWYGACESARKAHQNVAGTVTAALVEMSSTTTWGWSLLTWLKRFSVRVDYASALRRGGPLGCRETAPIEVDKGVQEPVSRFKGIFVGIFPVLQNIVPYAIVRMGMHKYVAGDVPEVT